MSWFNLIIGIILIAFGFFYGKHILKERETEEYKKSASAYQVSVWKGIAGCATAIVVGLIFVLQELKDLVM